MKIQHEKIFTGICLLIILFTTNNSVLGQTILDKFNKKVKEVSSKVNKALDGLNGKNNQQNKTKRWEPDNRITEQPQEQYSSIKSVLTKDMNEADYFENIFKFFGNDKDVNYGRTYAPNSLNYKVLSRDLTGFPSVVSGVYRVLTRFGELVKDSTEMIIYFEEGIPCRLTYPRDKYMWDVSAASSRKTEKLKFTPDQLKIIKQFNDIMDENQKGTFEENESLSLTSLLKKQDDMYPKEKCDDCITKNRTTETYTYDETAYDENNRAYKVEKNGNNHSIVIKNRCAYTVYIVGIKKMYSARTGYYYVDATKKFDANEIVSYSLDGVASWFNGGIGYFISMDINPNIQKEKIGVDGIQFLRIVSEKR
jgi:hypothetical protein